MTGNLTVSSVKKLTGLGVKGRTGDGNGLWLDVRGPGRAQWVLRYTLRGKAREAGLGPVDGVELDQARDDAALMRGLLRRGLDPLERKAALAKADADAVLRAAEAAAAVARTFKGVAEEMLSAHEAAWSNSKHRQQWRNTLTSYAYPYFGSLAVGDVTTEHVLAALAPIWTAKPETASRVRGRIEAVLDFAKARKWRTGENPAAWRGHLKMLLAAPRKLKRVRHQPALPWRQAPAFLAALRMAEGVGARALEFAIVTAARSGEVRGMTWGEVDADFERWTVPASRMKARREHRVPLSKAAVAVLESMRPWRASDRPDALVFPGLKAGQPLSDMSLSAVLRRMKEADGSPSWVDDQGRAVVPHGFRSTFRDWCAEKRGEPREVAEAALAHSVGDDTEAAYARSDLIDRRGRLMDAWAEYCAEERGSLHRLTR